MSESLTITCADDFENELSDGLRVGAVLTLKGKLEAVKYGDRNGNDTRGRYMASSLAAGARSADPSLCLAFADWSQIYVTIASYASAKGLRIPLGTQVVVKAMMIHEDGDLMAIAIWENGPNPVPIALSPDGLERLAS